MEFHKNSRKVAKNLLSLINLKDFRFGGRGEKVPKELL